MRKRIILISLAVIICIGVWLAVDSRSTGFRNQVAVLTYHHVDTVESEYTISPERLRDHLEALKANQFNVITTEQFVAFLKDGKPVPPNAVVITFDDGYESYYRYAYPELKKQGMPATNFLIVKSVGDRSAETPFMTWDEVKQMAKDGFDFYSHTYDAHGFGVDAKGKQLSPLTHPNWSDALGRMETEEEYSSRVLNDLTQAETILRQQLGNKLSILCLPHGRYTQSLIDIGNKAGIHYYYTGDYGLNNPGDVLVKRVTAGVPTLTGQGLVDKINKQTTMLGKAENVVKNIVLQIRYRYF
ncbi:polysaccharide deacetylase family protein [Paenibacillus sp. H1-7]|uniref:polysaccharide deacetylase family protein n=1 Tax=Paenibacillus sp. H1-7 TaxID=2282849 RepID=UPI001EF862CE|nr:polysaccharide deacetylase family protein [Paenibacillus sp. H1-7]ULL16176.1 polysaccharide deacetylase family protein [Paenibacillus sp. H1-7]